MLGHGQQPIPVTDVAGSCREMPLQEWDGILVKLATSSTHLVKALPFHSTAHVRAVMYNQRMRCSCTHVHLKSML